MVPIHRFVGSSILLFIDSIIVAGSNWIYWIVISNLASASTVGQATTIISLVTLVSLISQLGIEYPLLKRTVIARSKIFAPSLAIVLGISLTAMPIVVYVINNILKGSEPEFTWISVLMLLIIPIDFVSRFTLLGLSEARLVTIIDSVGVVTKLVLGYSLVLAGFGTSGILLSFLAHVIVIAIATFAFAGRKISIELKEILNLKDVVHDGLVNMPNKMSGVLVFSLSVVLLAAFGIDDSMIGLFYICLMITIVACGLLTSMAYMVIPASSMANTDLSTHSLRIGLSLTSPIIAVLISSPTLVLSIIGPDYVLASKELVVLAVSVLPFSVVMMSVSKFNSINKPKRIILLGFTQLATFIISFVVLVPHIGIMGGAFSILLAYGLSFGLTLLWTDRGTLRYIVRAASAIVIGAIAGYIVTLPNAGGEGIGNLVAIPVSIVVTFAISVALKNISIREFLDVIGLAGKGVSSS